MDQVKFVLKQTISLEIFQSLFSTSFTWSILEYFVSNVPLICSNTSTRILCSTRLFGYVVYIWIFEESIVNDRLIYLDTYFTSKAFGGTLFRITWALIKKKIRKVKTTKSVRHVKVSQIIILFPNSFRNWSQKSFFFFCSN